ncbi:MAG: tRNA (adenosine(37)-N6)-threonylcarbamoyltransferase complex ATPase subunit type 1 TsaE [Roseobacter sp.]
MQIITSAHSFASPNETALFATNLGSKLKPGDVVLLNGTVGAGKTHFARHLIQSLLLTPEDVPSPTFTLVQNYETVSGTLWHADLYRVSSIHEIEELGLTEAFDTAICLIEWPDRLGSLAPISALTLGLEDGETEDTRFLKASWSDQRWDNPMSELFTS